MKENNNNFAKKSVMETKKVKEVTKKLPGKEVSQGEKPKSKTTLFWEKYPNGILQILDKRAVLR
jgi:hypothetical protein